LTVIANVLQNEPQKYIILGSIGSRANVSEGEPKRGRGLPRSRCSLFITYPNAISKILKQKCANGETIFVYEAVIFISLSYNTTYHIYEVTKKMCN